MTVPNPYQPPPSTVEATSSPPPLTSENTKAFLVRWAIVLAINLVVPVILATVMIARESYTWLLSGVVIIFIGGALFGTAFVRLQRPLIAGSYALAITQFFPIIQIVAGAMALGLVEELGFPAHVMDFEGEDPSHLGVLLATVITAFELAAAAMCLGGLYVALNKRRRPVETVLPKA